MREFAIMIFTPRSPNQPGELAGHSHRHKPGWVARLTAIVAFGSLCGCTGGSNVVIPEPRKSVDEPELPSVAQKAVARKSKDANRPSAIKAATGEKGQRVAVSSTSDAARFQGQRATQPQNRSEAVSTAVDRAIRGEDGDESPPQPLRSSRIGADSIEDTPRPVDLSAWTHDNFRSAKQDNDIRLVQAVSLLGHSGVDADANAKLLIELLDDPAPLPTSAMRQSGTVTPSIRGLGQAIVGALSANPSETAKNAIKEIILGKLRTSVDDRTFTMAALKALIDQRNAEADALVYAVLTMPQAIRPAGRSLFTAEAMQKECAQMVRDTASPELRLQLAEYVANPTTPAAHRSLLLPVLMEQRPENLRAQTYLARADNFDSNQRVTLQRNLLAQTRRAMDAVMSVPDTVQLNSTDDAAVRSVFAALAPALLSESRSIGEVVWSNFFIDRVAARLNELPGPATEPDLWALATSIPSDVLRPIIRRQLFEHWIEGDSLTRLPPFTPTAIRDPGMLLVLKSLPREDASTRPSPARGRNAAQQQRLAEERTAKQAWNQAAYAMVQALMRRCEIGGQVARVAAAQPNLLPTAEPVDSVEELDRLLEQRKSGDKRTETEARQTRKLVATSEFPLDLPPGAVMETSYSLHWPEDLEGAVSAVPGSLVIHYGRAHLEEQGQRAVAFFSRQLKNAVERPLENGRWLDSASRPLAGKLRSVDVMIRREKSRSVMTTVVNRTSVEPLAVEILWIETSDFMVETLERADGERSSTPDPLLAR
jgi:hypothetical protein